MKFNLPRFALLTLSLLTLYPQSVRAEPVSSPLFQAWFEPLLGVSTSGHLKVSRSGAGHTQSFFSGLGLGSRLGIYWKKNLFVALDLNYFPALTQAESTGSQWTNTLLGLTLGARLPHIPMRFWIGYSFINHISPSLFLSPLGVNTPATLDGNSFKVGSSLELFTGYIVNAEFHLGSFTRYSAPGAQAISMPKDSAASHSYLFLSISKLMDI